MERIKRECTETIRRKDEKRINILLFPIPNVQGKIPEKTPSVSPYFLLKYKKDRMNLKTRRSDIKN